MCANTPFQMKKSNSWECCASSNVQNLHKIFFASSSLSSLVPDEERDEISHFESLSPYSRYHQRELKRSLLRRGTGNHAGNFNIREICQTKSLFNCSYYPLGECETGHVPDGNTEQDEFMIILDSDESESMEEEYIERKRRRIDCEKTPVFIITNEPSSYLSVPVYDSNCWNRLLRCRSESVVLDTTERQRDESDGLSGRDGEYEHDHDRKFTLTVDWIRGRAMSEETTTAAAAKFQRMRTSSVTLRRRCCSNADEYWTPTKVQARPTMERSVSVDIMRAAVEKSLAPRRFSDEESFRSQSWMRASMRLVRPFQLADPPPSSPDRPASTSLENSPTVQIELPPVFPCEVIERPSSTLAYDRPRQYGRRFSGFVASSSPESPLSLSRSSSSSASTLTWENDTTGARIMRQPIRSQPPSSQSPCRNATNAFDASVNAATVAAGQNESVSAGNTQISASARTIPTTTGTYEMSQESESPLGQWSHGLSSMLACLGCTLGIFNISRFAIFSIHFGANFIFQFLVLTVLIGIPMFTFHISLGQLLGTGVLNMWHISPIFKGIGVALLLSQAFIGVYSIIGVSWMLVYFRDSFISKQDVYRWAEPLELYGEDGVPTLKHNNGSYKIEQTVPDYFGGVVLQRRNILKQEEDLMNVKFSVAFNLAIVWIIIFLTLSKGLRSYGKVVYVFTILPIFGMTLLCAKLLGFLPGTSKDRGFLPETDWGEFFLNSKSWIAAFTEVFLTWGVFGATAMQITSHNRQKHFLFRDSALVVIITVLVLLMSAFIANMCSQLLEYNNFVYLPSSFERSATYIFLQRRDIPLPYSYAVPIRWMSHSGLILGERTIKPQTNICHESGYQPLRLATELVPATFAAIGPKIISPFWSILFYFVFIMFGLAQQMAIWYGVISNIISINVKALKPCWTTITWFTCITGFILGLPMTTETGIFVVYFLDFVIGCGWWIMILYLLQLGAVFIVRGRPYSGETIVTNLFTRSNYFLQNWIAPMFSFNWNVVVPVTLLLLSTSVFKNGGYRMLYNWHSPKFYEYWPPWSRKFGCLLQVLPLFIIPLIGIIQSYLYLTDGPLDLFERIQLLYRPVMENSTTRHSTNPNDVESNNRNSNGSSPNIVMNDDPPPKYTPPPSYSTATGAKIAKLLRQSFRRSVVRIAHVLGSTNDSVPSTSDEHQTPPRQLPPPPDYSAVLVEINQSVRTDGNSHRRSDEQSSNPTFTVQDVANILRTSLRRNRTLPVHSVNNNNNLVEQECTSIQCLVESVAPINQDSIIVLNELKTEEQPTL